MPHAWDSAPLLQTPSESQHPPQLGEPHVEPDAAPSTPPPSCESSFDTGIDGVCVTPPASPDVPASVDKRPFNAMLPPQATHASPPYSISPATHMASRICILLDKPAQDPSEEWPDCRSSITNSTFQPQASARGRRGGRRRPLRIAFRVIAVSIWTLHVRRAREADVLRGGEP
jgi:hypothetical protein